MKWNQKQFWKMNVTEKRYAADIDSEVTGMQYGAGHDQLFYNGRGHTTVVCLNNVCKDGTVLKSEM